MKLWAVYIILLFSTIGFGQTTKNKDKKTSIKSGTKLKVVFSMYNHAERFYDGVTTFILTDSLIEIKKRYYGNKKSKVIYSKIISDTSQLMSELKKVRLDSLENYYFNNCVMIASGDEYYLDFVCVGSINKSVSLHEYYVEEVAEIVKLINSTLPDKYQFRYASKAAQQDCK